VFKINREDVIMETKKFPTMDVLAVLTGVAQLASNDGNGFRRLVCFMTKKEDRENEIEEELVYDFYEQCVPSLFNQFPAFLEFDDLVQDLIDVGIDCGFSDDEIIDHIFATGAPQIGDLLREFGDMVEVERLHPNLIDRFIETKFTTGCESLEVGHPLAGSSNPTLN
jgi:hypothetical protein